jgi:hypothetical protein
MSDANGSTHPSSGGPEKPTSPAEDTSSEQPGLVNEPVERTTIPLKIMVVSIAVLLAVVTIVGLLVTRTTAPPRSGPGPFAPEPTGIPVLPVQAGEYVRDPGTASAPPDFGVDRSILTSSAYYRRHGDNALIAVAARPVPDEKVLLDQIKVLAQRQVGEGWCGREQSTGYDLCALRRNQTAVFAVGLRDQTPEEIMAALVMILGDTE